MTDQLRLNFETDFDEIDPEDLQAAADKFDDIKSNPVKYFTPPDKRKSIISGLEKAARSCIDKSNKINVVNKYYMIYMLYTRTFRKLIVKYNYDKSKIKISSSSNYRSNS
jgi:hypothetical protein